MKNIKELREEYKISLEELSLRSNIPLPIIYQIEDMKDLKKEDEEIISKLFRAMDQIVSERRFEYKKEKLNNSIETDIFKEEKMLKHIVKFTFTFLICVIVCFLFFIDLKLRNGIYDSNKILEIISEEVEKKNDDSYIQNLQNNTLELKKKLNEILKEEERREKKVNKKEIILQIVISLLLLIFLISNYWKQKIRNEKEKFIDKLSVEQVINELEKDFINNLVKVNIYQINSYNSQTKSQANKSFFIAMIGAIFGLIIVIFGLHLVYLNNLKPGYFVTGVGVLIEFIAGTVFYLYNKTVTKMGEYHKKLVLVQNIALSLKATEEFGDQEKHKVRGMIVQSLLQDINKYLAEK